MSELTFLAEIINVQAKKTASLDIEVRLTVRTDDTRVLELGKLPADTLLRITVEPTE